jgi:hypothetical protein
MHIGNFDMPANAKMNSCLPDVNGVFEFRSSLQNLKSKLRVVDGADFVNEHLDLPVSGEFFGISPAGFIPDPIPFSELPNNAFFGSIDEWSSVSRFEVLHCAGASMEKDLQSRR